MDCQKVFFIFFACFAAFVVSKPFFSIDVLDSDDSLMRKESDVVKRTVEGSNDVAELRSQTISLSSLISNIENGLVQTALSVGSVASNPNAQVQVVTTPHSVNKRSTVEGSTTATHDSQEILVQTTENVVASELVPAHVVIDRVSVYKAPAAGTSFFPTFHLQETIVSGETGELLAKVEGDEYVAETSTTGKRVSSSSSESSESSESSDSSESSEEESSSSLSPEKSSTTGASTDETTTHIPTPTTSESSSSTTTDLPVDDIQSVEKDLKEKVAEVEADPVILTARV